LDSSLKIADDEFEDTSDESWPDSLYVPLRQPANIL
jgi:hypothetical protein